MVAQEDLSLPARTPLPAGADPPFDRIAALTRRLLDVPIAMVTLVDRTRQVMPGAAGLPAALDAARELPLSMSLCQHVVRSGTSFVVSDAPADSRVNTLDVVSVTGVSAYAGMPLIDESGATAGSLCVIGMTPRDWSAAELDLLADLAAMCSAELQLRSAARRAEADRERTRVLLTLSETLARSGPVADLAARVHSLATSRMQASFGGITVLDDSSATLAYVDPGRTEDPDTDGFDPTVPTPFRRFALTAALPSASVVRTGRPLFFATRAALVAAFPAVADAAPDDEAYAYLPLFSDGRVRGSLALSWSQERDVDDADREVLMAFAQYTAQALRRTTLLAERHEVAATLQQALLPVLPTVPDVEMGGRYLPAEATEAVGGDWYDAFDLPDRTLVFSVGDVSGHDTGAAAMMGQLRASLRALASIAPVDPASRLTALDDLMRSFARVRLATAVLGTITRDDGVTTLTWSNAGHLPPLLLEPGRPATYLVRAYDRLLGVRLERPTRTNHRLVLPPGSTLVLYTDGLLERRDRDLDDGLAVLAHSCEQARDLPIDGLLDTVIATTHDASHHDDTVLFAIRTA